MREIKFKGKRTDNSEWVYGSLVSMNSGLCYIVSGVHAHYTYTLQTLNCDFTIPVDPATVGQYTGLKDKNGKEIYEGDIITAFGDRPYSVFWNFFCYCLESLRYPNINYQPKWPDEIEDSEVIGNIHDNQEQKGQVQE